MQLGTTSSVHLDRSWYSAWGFPEFSAVVLHVCPKSDWNMESCCRQPFVNAAIEDVDHGSVTHLFAFFFLSLAASHLLHVLLTSVWISIPIIPCAFYCSFILPSTLCTFLSAQVTGNICIGRIYSIAVLEWLYETCFYPSLSFFCITQTSLSFTKFLHVICISLNMHVNYSHVSDHEK